MRVRLQANWSSSVISGALDLNWLCLTMVLRRHFAALVQWIQVRRADEQRVLHKCLTLGVLANEVKWGCLQIWIFNKNGQLYMGKYWGAYVKSLQSNLFEAYAVCVRPVCLSVCMCFESIKLFYIKFAVQCKYRTSVQTHTNYNCAPHLWTKANTNARERTRERMAA